MPLETATYISQLVTSNPAASDGMNTSDDHLRLIKAAVKTTFPNLTGAVTATQDQLNSVISGVSTVNDAGVFFKTSGDGFKNSLAGDIDVWIGGQIGATFQNTAGTNFFKVTGQISATTLKGGGMVPIGGILIWPSDTLPPADEGTFAWCNGASYSKTTYATCYARIGNSIDATTFAVPNYQEVALVGKSGMGGAASPGLLSSIAAGVKGVLNQLFGTDTKALLRTDLPNVAPTFAGITGTVSVSGAFTGFLASNTFNTGTAPNPCNYGSNQAITVNSSGSFTPAGNIQSLNGGVTQTSFGIAQPSRTTNFIIRLA